MKCFIIALESEAKPVIVHMTQTRTTTRCGKKIVQGKLCDEDVAVVICGVGKVNAGAGAQYAIDMLGADAIINVGLAGGLNDRLRIGNIYCISAAVQYDFDLVQLNKTTIGTLNEFKENYLPLTTVSGYPAKKLATGDRFNDDEDDRALLTRVLQADIRDMEGGAIAQVCAHAGVRAYSFKVISDLAGSESTTDQFTKNLALCAKTLEENIKNIFGAIDG